MPTTIDGSGRRAATAAVVAAVALAGCGGRPSGSPAVRTSKAGSWSATTCRRQTQVIADDARQILLHYGAQSAYPADLAYYMFRGSLLEFERHSCAPQVLGRTLAHRLTRAQLAALLSHLPSTTGLYLRRALPPNTA